MQEPGANRLPISVCLVSGAEEHRIERCLASIADWTSEIVVVLNEEVKDRTGEIAVRFGAKVFREPWKGFIGQKNSAAEKCSQPWLLNLDADEVVSGDLRRAIAEAVAGEPPPHAAFEFPRCTFYCGRWIRHGDWYPDRVLRLWRRGSARWGGEDPHAQLRVDGSVGRLKADLEHYSFDSINHQISKIGPYADPFVRKRLANGRSAGVLDLTVRPAWRFLRAYIFRLGFLDGWPGYYIAWVNAFATLTRYTKVREAQLTGRPSPKP